MKSVQRVQTLKSLQQKFAAALMTPLTKTDSIARTNGRVRDAIRLVKPNRRLKAFERLEIYSRSYWFRLLGSLSEDFPGLIAILGAEVFERMARAYLAEYPSESFTLRDLGGRLEVWLRAHLGYAGTSPLLALDMVQLEWAHIVAFDGPKAPTPEPETLTGLGPQMKLGLQPYMSLLELHHPVDELRVRVNASPDGPEAASNAGLRKKYKLQCQRLVRSIKLSKPELHFVAVHRLDLKVYYRRLSREEFLLLQALRDGLSIAAGIDAAFDDSSVESDEIPGLLEIWFSSWAQLGWLTYAQKGRKGSK